MNYDIVRTVVLFILVGAFALIAGDGGFAHFEFAHAITEVGIAILAGALCFLAFLGLDSASARKIEQIAANFDRIVNSNVSREVLRIDRNVDLGEEFWRKLVTDLDNSPEPAWFVGSKLSRWRESVAYRNVLRSKLVERSRRYIERGTHEGEGNYVTYILLSEEEAVSQWRTYRDELCAEVRSVCSAAADQVEMGLGKALRIGLVPADMMKYSCVLCGKRIVVTHYTSTGRLEDSATMDIAEGSLLRELYENDLAKLSLYATV